MEMREDALREALAKNAEETARWKNYKEENITAIENLDKFSKYLTVDVMVPLGQKAYMPGQLVHTNETLIGHYQGFFSKGSAHKAKEICQHRVKMAVEHLDSLKAEADLWQNKLEKPYVAGVFPSTGENELIEDYDEEKEKVWRENHKLRVKEAKEREKADREQIAAKEAEVAKNADLTDNELFKMLEEAELMEELKNELESLAIDDVSYETIRKLMAGDMKLPPEKLRASYTSQIDQKNSKDELIQILDKSNNNEILELQGIVKKTDLEVSSIRTNNNHRPNMELVQSNYNHSCESEGDVEELPQEVKIIKEQAKFLPVADQIGFYEYQITIMREKLLALPLKTQDDIDQKVHILNVLESLEELLEIAEDSAEGEKEIPADIKVIKEVKEQEIKTDNLHQEGKQRKRRISFALQNETLEFRRNETVSEMLPKPQRDIVKLDEHTADPSTFAAATLVKVIDRKQAIIDRVEQNLRFMEENQSTKDFKLVDKILESSISGCQTLYIHFQHSTKPSIETTGKSENLEGGNIPGSPADLYQAYLQNIRNQNVTENKSNSEQIIFTNAYNGEENVKVPLLKETDRATAYEDQRKQFCKPSVEIKSILRNKSAVEKEKHKLDRKNRAINSKKVPKKKKEKPEGRMDYRSAYYKIMNEVVEKPITEAEPLPECKYIDAHAPKKRLSRFKQSRAVAENA
ncbi:unconventional prefoldin RPB5 interactor-like protein [Anastrepha ludens]|uniref:unconventional prefoldin RPB5 interactor-like protein n=1 Tax=Anastrepha ludens TaxID=28586 RepID=UPI0023AF85F9|nr:unconventional prefoldin RPB5 interactor-like protein [Anastrepha ludens]XP_053962978.1 unconventional prefoldin RPB5 interactor-like protein [Anastrepha ludens]